VKLLTAASTAACLLALAVGCSGNPATGPRMSPAGDHKTPSSSPVTASCSLRGLVTTLRTGLGAGHSFGAFEFRARRKRPCAMSRPIELTPLDARGRRVPHSRRLVSGPPHRLVVLTTVTKPSVRILVAGGTGDALNHGCPPRHILAPAAWRIALAGHHIVVPNSKAGPQLFTCTFRHMTFGADPQRSEPTAIS
jgi:hypothetical protein